MPAAEIAAAVQSVRACFDLAKATISLRDAEAFRTKSVELHGLILQALEKSIEAREAESAQLQSIRTLETELAHLKAWDAEKKNYELKSVSSGAVVYMLKPEVRAAGTPHWLCPNCYEQGKKSFFQPTGRPTGRFHICVCSGCKSEISVSGKPAWIDA